MRASVSFGLGYGGLWASAGFRGRLEALNPLSVLGRGYAVVTRQADGKLVSQLSDAKPKDGIRVSVSDGTFDAVVSNDKES